MSAQFNAFGPYTRQLTATANRMGELAMTNAESVFGVQLRTLERTSTASAGFLGELAQPGAQADLTTLLPKGLQVARDNLAHLASAGDEVIHLGLKASEAFAELVREPLIDTGARSTDRSTR